MNSCELFKAELSKSGSSSVVERLLAKEEVASSNLVFRSRRYAEVAEVVDATVSKTVGGQPSCRFESDLRHQIVAYLLSSYIQVNLRGLYHANKR